MSAPARPIPALLAHTLLDPTPLDPTMRPGAGSDTAPDTTPTRLCVGPSPWPTPWGRR
ncbi:MAG TPA: hypothetical protein VE196_00250 [Pseudonocardiaceae bacterium]|nr:hypothetical protein [Pseudonocardiaceae bacterium]